MREIDTFMKSILLYNSYIIWYHLVSIIMYVKFYAKWQVSLDYVGLFTKI